MSGAPADELLARLFSALRAASPLVIAFSGGVDSRFLCHAAGLAGAAALAAHAFGPHVPPGESRFARDWAEKRGLRFVGVEYDPLRLPEVAGGTRERCYACKRGLIAGLRAAASGMLRGPFTLCDGTNADDLQDFRPGQRALAEAGVLSPLAGAGIGKADIRRLARLSGLDWPEQGARPCLLTRLDYGIAPEKALLARILACESELGGIGRLGDFRLRLVPEPLLQAQTLAPEDAAGVADIMERHGFFPFRTLVCERVSGFFDRAVPAS